MRCYGELTESSNITTDIADFCKMFMLVTTPSEREITEVIAKELSMDLHVFSPDIAKNIIDSFFQRIVKWATEHEDKFYERNELENVLENLKNQMKTLMLEGGQLLYCEHLKSFDLIFKELLIECKKFLDSIYPSVSVKQILRVQSNDPVLTAIKLEQTLRARTYDSFYKKVLFYPLTSYLNWERAIRGNRMAPFKFEDTCNLMVIVEDKIYENSQNFYDRVCDSLKNFAHMKMIIITSTESVLIENLKICFDNAKGSSGPGIVKFDDVFHSAPTTDNCTFTSLSKESQENLLKSKVQFFGKPIILNTLIDNQTLYDFIDQLTFLKLIKKEDVIIGQTSDPDRNSGFYTPRNIGLIEIDSKLLKEKKSLYNNIIAIEGTNETFEEDARQLLLKNNVKTENIYTADSLLPQNPVYGMIYVIFDPSTSEDQYNKLCENYESIHWLKSVENRLLWCSSTNSPLEFFGFHAKRNSYFTGDISALPYFFKNKTVVIADKAGMGKSTILTNFAHEIQKNTIKKWIIKIDLNFYNKTLKEIHAKKGLFREEFKIRFEKQEENRWDKNDMEEYGKVILKALINEDEKDTRHVSLEENLFRSFFKNGDMIIMFDGFDEINPRYEEVVKYICLELKSKTKNQIWITTRTNLQNDLERDLKKKYRLKILKH
uniref:NACHT domain-containing protein n=1 Tax=Panagrolaimus sp. PS1159 TaxID=55785 RepID=A0AC35G6P9_9BILA